MTSVTSFNLVTSCGVMQFAGKPSDRERASYADRASEFFCRVRGDDDIRVTILEPGRPTRIVILPSHLSKLRPMS